jgi:hypothetical protein
MCKRFFTVLFCIALINGSFSQEDFLPRFNVRAHCVIPKIVGSQAWRISFLGVYDAGITFNLRVAGNLTAGIGYKNALFNSTAEYRNKGVFTQHRLHEGVLRLGVDKRTGPKSFISFAINGGYGLNQYIAVKAIKDSLNGKYPTSFTAGFVRPEFNANFLIEDNFAFGIVLAYNMTLATYDPKLNCFATYDNFAKYRNKAYMGWFSFGFGFYWGYKKNKKG